MSNYNNENHPHCCGRNAIDAALELTFKFVDSRGKFHGEDARAALNFLADARRQLNNNKESDSKSPTQHNKK